MGNFKKMSRRNVLCSRKCFAQLLFISALSIHQQVCQCYAGGNVNGGRRSPLLSRTTPISNSLQPHQALFSLNRNNRRKLDLLEQHLYASGENGSGRRYDSKLGQASIVTAIEDEEEDTKGRDKGLSIRGGDTYLDEDRPPSPAETVADSPSTLIPGQTLGENNGDSHNTITGNHDVHETIKSEHNGIEVTNDFNQNNESSSIQIEEVERVQHAEVIEVVSETPPPTIEYKRKKKWPCGDELDKQLIKIALPCIANFAINPLVGAVDLFWINRMGNTLAVAGQAAANQIFSSSFWITSFLPSVTATLVAKQYAKKSEEGVQDALCQALFLGSFIALLGSAFILSQPDRLLGGVLSAGAPAREFAKPYLFIRGFAFLPSMLSLIGFSAFRGVMDTVTPLKISLFANLLNALLDPILIFTFKMGVTGAALATLASEITSAVIFTTMLFKRKMIVPSKMFRLPDWAKLTPLLKGGAALQLRNFALNITFLAVTRVTQSIDNTGVAAAAHAMAIQTFQIGGIVLLALSTVAQILVPNAMIEKIDEKSGEKTGGMLAAKDTVSRLMRWGLILGAILGSLQVLLLPSLQKSTPIIAVREAARVPALLASLYQVINGLVFIGEGVMVGCGSFLQLSLSTLVATIGTVIALKELPKNFGLTGVWMSFGVFNTLRLAGVYIHQKINGPLTPQKTKNI